MAATPRLSRRRLILASGIAPVLLVCMLTLLRPAALARLDDAAYDVVVRMTGTKPPDPGVAIVDVDERSLESVGQWPWRRDVVGQLVVRLRDAGAAVVAIDIMFAEPDRYVSTGGANAESPDEAFARALRESPAVLGYGLHFDPRASARRPCVLHPAPLAIVQPPDAPAALPLFQATATVCNLPILSEAARRSGFLNAAPDRDGILRRVPLLAELDGRVYPSLAVAAVTAAHPASPMVLRVENVNASQLSIGDRVVPLDGRGNLLLGFRGKRRTFPYFSAADVLNGTMRADALRGKIVFVGTTALGTREVVATPLDTQFVGVEVQATTADNLLQQDFVHRTPFGSSLDALAVLAIGIALAMVITSAGVVAGLAAGAVSVIGLWWGAAWLLESHRVAVSPLFSTMAILACVSAMTLAKFTVERGRADTESREKAAAQRLMVQTLLSLTEVRDAETGRHSRRTQQYARLLAEPLAAHPEYRDYLTRERIDLLASLAPLHDIGKVGIPDRVLNKPGALTAEEQMEMRRHPELGREVILKAEARVGVRDDVTLQLAKDIVYTHHERWDGTGYPQGLQANDIPVAGRIMALVDVYDAVRARSLYKKCMSHDEAVALIVRGKGTHFDPAVVDAFLRVSESFEVVSSEALPEVVRA
ncbi:MAG TPA: CHASE2 domain-containing protein [Vicinamibacterales bacterium]|nr:CHASE2 domain-containing protein [Vicinamibacterales bacterium]